jgi:hypothetical protein
MNTQTGYIPMWTVTHYWMVIYDQVLRKSEWVQFVVSNVNCYVIIREHFGDNAPPGGIINKQITTLEKGRKLWQQYITEAAGEYFPHLDDVRMGDD